VVNAGSFGNTFCNTFCKSCSKIKGNKAMTDIQELARLIGEAEAQAAKAGKPEIAAALSGLGYEVKQFVREEQRKAAATKKKRKK